MQMNADAAWKSEDIRTVHWESEMDNSIVRQKILRNQFYVRKRTLVRPANKVIANTLKSTH